MELLNLNPVFLACLASYGNVRVIQAGFLVAPCELSLPLEWEGCSRESSSLLLVTCISEVMR